MLPGTSSEGLQDVTENLWDTQSPHGKHCPQDWLHRADRNQVVMAIIPDVEPIQGTMKTSCLPHSFQGLQGGDG